MDKSLASRSDSAPVRLRVFRVRHGLTQSDLGARIQVDKADVSRYENGNTLPSLKTAARIEILTGIPAISWIDKAEISQDLSEGSPPPGPSNPEDLAAEDQRGAA